METAMGIPVEDEDPDRRPTTLLGRLRRFFDRGRGSDSHWHDWWDTHRGGGYDGPYRHGWGGPVGGGCGSGGCGGGCCGSGGCGGGGCGSC